MQELQARREAIYTKVGLVALTMLPADDDVNICFHKSRS
jgi:hypothetical protein